MAEAADELGIVEDQPDEPTDAAEAEAPKAEGSE